MELKLKFPVDEILVFIRSLEKYCSNPDLTNIKMVVILSECLRGVCQEYSLKESESKIIMFLKYLPKETRIYDYRANVRDLLDTIEREIKNSIILRIPSKNERYFEQELKQWGPVIDAYPDLRDDIEWAGKYIAMGNYKDALYRLMQVMEVGLQALAEKAGLEVKPRQMMKDIFDNIEKNIDIKKDTKKISTKVYIQYRKIMRHADDARIIWRNEVSHASLKEKKQYEGEEVELAYMSTKSFMKALLILPKFH
jgi:hypothetical protein